MSTVKRNVLTGLQTFQLMTLIKEAYQEQGLPDTQFAEYATGKLGFTVPTSSVFTYRTQLDIPSIVATRRLAKEEAEKLLPSTLDLRIKYLEDAVTRDFERIANLNLAIQNLLSRIAVLERGK
jgi:hypothetical protein